MPIRPLVTLTNDPHTHSIVLSGILFNGQTTQGFSCIMTITHTRLVQLQYEDSGQKHQLSFAYDDIKVPSRLGNSARIVHLPNGLLFETKENNRLDHVVSQFETRWYRFNPYHWESKWRYVLLAFCIVTLCSLGVLFYGLPKLSESIAHQLPIAIPQGIGNQTIQQLDSYVFSKSNLTPERKKILTDLFLTMVDSLYPSSLTTHSGAGGIKSEQERFNYKLLFRQGGKIGPNAMALPNGTIIITDELEALASNDFELQAILYHEIAHVEQRHALQQSINTSGAALILSWMFGDIEASSELLMSIPLIFVSTGYSRDFENQADEFALVQMTANQIDPNYFANIMTKLMQHQHEGSFEKEKSSDPHNTASRFGAILDFFSTHPNTSERIEKFRHTSGN